MEKKRNSLLQVGESQSWSNRSRASTNDSGRTCGSQSVSGACERNKTKSLRERASATVFSTPGRWTQWSVNCNKLRVGVATQGYHPCRYTKWGETITPVAQHNAVGSGGRELLQLPEVFGIYVRLATTDLYMTDKLQVMHVPAHP